MLPFRTGLINQKAAGSVAPLVVKSEMCAPSKVDVTLILHLYIQVSE